MARQLRRDRSKAGANLIHRILTTDHAGRGDQHIARRAAEGGGDTADDFASVRQSVDPRGDIGVLGDHHDGTAPMERRGARD